MDFNTNIFETFDKQWALLTAGDMDNFNTMTISWGGLGTLWGKPVITSYIRQSRLTHDYIDNNEYFTVSFYPEEYKKILGILGSKSGRDMDKMHESGLTPVACENTVTFKEAKTTFLCKKLFKQTIDTDNIPADLQEKFYPTKDDHDMYIAEVISIL